MSLDDFAAKLKAKRAANQQQAGADQKPYDHAQSYQIRAKMLGVLLRDARESAARTIEDCARLLRLTPQEIKDWEFGEAVPSLPQLELLAYYLDVPVSHFWGLETLKQTRSGREAMQPEYVKLRSRMIGAKLRQAREQQHLSLDDLADSVALPASQIAAYELGEVSPPMHELSVLASAVDQNVTYFLETDGHIGELLANRESWKHFADLPDDVRAFAADPKNIGFIHIAVMLSKMPADRLREVGASILDITM